MKTINTLLSIILLSFNLSKAQIPNADFELWTDFGNYEDPNDWSTLNYLGNGDFETVKRTDESYLNLYAARIENSKDDDDNVIRAQLLGGNNGFAKKPGFDYKKRPYSLKGYYKYEPNGIDSCYMLVSLWKFNNSTKKRDLIGSGKFSTASKILSYTAFTIPVNYLSAEYPDTAVIELYAGSVLNPIKGSRLTIDALSFEETQSGIENITVANFYIFPLPFHNEINIQCNNPQTATIEVYNSIGILIKKYDLISTHETIRLTLHETGMLYIRALDKNNMILFSGTALAQ